MNQKTKDRNESESVEEKQLSELEKHYLDSRNLCDICKIKAEELGWWNVTCNHTTGKVAQLYEIATTLAEYHPKMTTQEKQRVYSAYQNLQKFVEEQEELERKMKEGHYD